MNEKIIEALKVLNIPVAYGWYDASIKDTHITFFSYSDNDTNFEDDKSTATENYYQIDIWSKENLQDLKKNVKAALKNIGMKYIDGADLFEIDTKIYHKAMRFYGVLQEE